MFFKVLPLKFVQCPWIKICPKFSDKYLSENFSSEMEFVRHGVHLSGDLALRPGRIEDEAEVAAEAGDRVERPPQRRPVRPRSGKLGVTVHSIDSDVV
jgi:hypothetical protein